MSKRPLSDLSDPIHKQQRLNNNTPHPPDLERSDNIYATEDLDADDFITADQNLIRTETGAIVDLDELIKLADTTTTPMNAIELGGVISSLSELINQNIIEAEALLASGANKTGIGLLQNEQAILDNLKLLEHRFTVETHLYPSFIQYGGVRLLLSIIPHDNITIAITACNLLMGLITTDELEPMLENIPTISPQKYHYTSKIPQYNIDIILKKHLSKAIATTNSLTSYIKPFGYSYFIIAAINQVNGFSSIFEHCLLLNDLLRPHRECLETVLTTIETILEYGNHFFHSLLSSNFIHFLLLRLMYNDSIFLNNDNSTKVVTYDMISTKKLAELNYLYGEAKIAPLSQLKRNEFYAKHKSRHNSENIIISTPQPVAEIKTNRLHCAELLSMVCSLDTIIFIDYMVSKPFCFDTNLYNAVITANAGVNKFDIVNVNEFMLNKQQQSQPQLAATNLSSYAKSPFHRTIYRYTIHTTADLFKNTLLTPQTTYFETLLDFFEMIATQYYSSVNHSAEMIEFVENILSIFQALLLSPTLHPTTMYFTTAMKMAISLYHNVTYNQQLHAHCRMMWVALSKGMALMLSLLRSQMCLDGVKLLESACYCDTVYENLLLLENLTDLELNNNNNLVVNIQESTFNIICEAVVTASTKTNNYIGILFGYMEHIPSIKNQDDKNEFFSLLLSIHSHLLVNLQKTRQDGTNGNDSTLKRILAKYTQNKFSKINTLLHHISPLFVSLYTTLPADIQPIFNPADIFMGYTASDAVNENEYEIMTNKVTFRCPVNIIENVDENQDDDDIIYAHIHGDEMFERFYPLTPYKSLNSISIIILSVYFIILNQIMADYKENDQEKRDAALSTLDTTFIELFVGAKVDVNIVFNIISESRFYAGDTMYGLYLNALIETFYPLVRYMNNNRQ